MVVADFVPSGLLLWKGLPGLCPLGVKNMEIYNIFTMDFATFLRRLIGKHFAWNLFSISLNRISRWIILKSKPEGVKRFQLEEEGWKGFMTDVSFLDGNSIVWIIVFAFKLLHVHTVFQRNFHHLSFLRNFLWNFPLAILRNILMFARLAVFVAVQGPLR